MRRGSLAVLGFVAVACSRPSPVVHGPVEVDHDPEAAPGWAVPYGREFWREGTQTVDLGAVVDRVSHAIADEGVESRTYRARFDGSGLRFTPAGGEEALVRTLSIRRGRERLFEAGRATPWRITGNTAQTRLDERGELVEHHEARAGGVEITWVLRTPPAGAGPLAIDLEVRGERVRVGDAVAIDANGRSFAVASRPYRGGVRFEVDAETLAFASYPLAIDPLVGAEIPIDDASYSPDALDQSNPEAAFGGGVWLVAWNDRESLSSTATDVRAARVDATGAVLDPVGIPVAAFTSFQVIGSVGFDGTDFFLVWADRRDNVQYDLYAGRVRPSDGAVLQRAALVLDPAAQTNPRAIFDGTDFFTTWIDTRNGNADVYGTRVRPSDLVVLDVPHVPISTAPLSQQSVSMSLDPANYVVAWADSRNGASTNTDIYAARVRRADRMVLDTAGAPIVVLAEAQGNPALTFDGTNYFVAWEDRRSTTTYDVYGTRLDTSLGVIDSPHVPVVTGALDQRDVRSVFDGTNHVVAWRHAASPHTLQAARVRPSDGVVLDAPPKTLGVSGGVISGTLIASNGSELLAAWGGTVTNAGTDVSAARFASDLTPIGGEFRISGKIGWRRVPAAAFDGTSHLVVWQQEWGDGDDVLGARVREADGVVLDPAGIRISTVTGLQSDPDVAWGGTSWLVVWDDSRITSNVNVHGARVASDGTVLDAAGIPISTATGSQFWPSVAVSGTSYLVAWADLRGGGAYDVYASRVHTSTGAVVDPAGIAVTTFTDTQWHPSVAGGSSQFLVTWNDRRNGSHGDIYASRVTTEGAVLDGQGFVVSNGPSEQHDPAAEFDGTNYFVVWHDSRVVANIADIYGARVVPGTAALLDGNGVPIGAGPGERRDASLAYSGDGGYFVAWTDRRSGTNNDVYGTRVRASDLAVLDPDGIPIATLADDEIWSGVSAGANRFLVTYSRRDPAYSNGYRAFGRFVMQTAPVAVNDVGTTDEDVPLSVAAPGVLGNDSDLDGDALQAVLVTAPLRGSVTLNADGSYLYTPGSNLHGTDSFAYRAFDGVTQSSAATVTLTVAPINDPPFAAFDAYDVDEDQTLSPNALTGVLVNDSDVDGDPMTVMLGTTTANGTLSLSTSGAFTYLPDADFNGSDSFTYRAFDGAVASELAAIVMITVGPVNDAPVAAVPGAQNVAEDGTLTITAVSASDVDHATLSITLTVGQGVLTLDGTGGLTFTTGDGVADASLAFSGSLAAIDAALDGMTYAPAQDYGGADTLEVGVSDGALAANDAVAITVDAVNDAPVSVVPGAQSVAEDTDLPLVLSLTDIEGGDLQVTLAVTAGTLTLPQTTGLTFTSGDGAADAQMTFGGSLADLVAALDGVVYRGNANANGSDTLTMTADDLANGGPGALTDTEAVELTVTPVNDAPAAPVAVSPVGGAIVEERTPMLTVTNASDIDDATLIYSFEVRNGATVVGSATGIAAGAGTTSWTVDPPLAQGETYTWTATAADAAGATATSTEATFEIEPAVKRAGCACDLSSTSSTNPGTLLLGLLFAAVAFTRRRH